MDPRQMGRNSIGHRQAKGYPARQECSTERDGTGNSALGDPLGTRYWQPTVHGLLYCLDPPTRTPSGLFPKPMSTERSPAKRDERGILELIRSHPDPKRVKPRRVFANATRDGGIYRWGLAVAGGRPGHASPSNAFACGGHGEASRHGSPTRLGIVRADRLRQATAMIDLEALPRSRLWNRPPPHGRATTLAGRWIFPMLSKRSCGPRQSVAISRDAQLGSKGARRNTGSLLDDETASEFIMTLLRLHEDALDKALPLSTPLHLMLGGELGLTLAWHFPEIDHREEIVRHSAEAISQWCNLGAESVSTALEAPTFTRMALASLIRCGDVLGHVF